MDADYHDQTFDSDDGQNLNDSNGMPPVVLPDLNGGSVVPLHPEFYSTDGGSGFSDCIGSAGDAVGDDTPDMNDDARSESQASFDTELEGIVDIDSADPDQSEAIGDRNESDSEGSCGARQLSEEQRQCLLGAVGTGILGGVIGGGFGFVGGPVGMALGGISGFAGGWGSAVRGCSSSTNK